MHKNSPFEKICCIAYKKISTLGRKNVKKALFYENIYRKNLVV